MTNGDRRLTREKTDPHQSQADSGQPVLARLSVGVEEGPDALRTKTEGLTITHTKPVLLVFGQSFDERTFGGAVRALAQPS